MRLYGKRESIAEGVRLTCACCGFTKVFSNDREAFDLGWDGPPYFTGYVACDLCPGSFIVLGKTHLHDADHKRWAQSGRPDRFQIPRDEEGGRIVP